MLFNMKGRPLIVLLRFSFIKDFIFKIIERLSCVDVKGLRCLCYEDHQGNQWETVLRSWTSTSSACEYCGCLCTCDSSTSSACEYCACVLVTRVLPMLALEIIVVLCSWLRGWEDTRCCLLRGRRHPPREEESPLLHRLDFLSFGKTHLLQIIIWMDQPLANDHLDGLASCKWSSG